MAKFRPQKRNFSDNPLVELPGAFEVFCTKQTNALGIIVDEGQITPRPGLSVLPTKYAHAKVLPTLTSIQSTQNTLEFAHDTVDLRALLRDALAASSDIEMLAVLQVGREEMPKALKTLQRTLERIGVVPTPPAPPNAPAGGPFQPAPPAYTARGGQDRNPFSDIANRVKTGKGDITRRSVHSKSHVYLPDMRGLTSTVESLAKDSEALESLISMLQTHLMRLTSELSSHQELLTELRKLRERDSCEVEVLCGVIEEESPARTTPPLPSTLSRPLPLQYHPPLQLVLPLSHQRKADLAPRHQRRTGNPHARPSHTPSPPTLTQQAPRHDARQRRQWPHAAPEPQDHQPPQAEHLRPAVHAGGVTCFPGPTSSGSSTSANANAGDTNSSTAPSPCQAPRSAGAQRREWEWEWVYGGGVLDDPADNWGKCGNWGRGGG
ncbi:hypothetical protein B0H14DRAFT_3634991 [Mycena olivaceomarginata]|nr:hypothetical protein B0H14DRAFT_3634991 [Mycena olivaceomarginata]